MYKHVKKHENLISVVLSFERGMHPLSKSHIAYKLTSFKRPSFVGGQPGLKVKRISILNYKRHSRYNVLFGQVREQLIFEN